MAQNPKLADMFCDAIDREPGTIIMCGVGRGDESKVFASRFPNARIVGVEPMVAQAWKFSGMLIGAALVEQRHAGPMTFYERVGKSKASSLFASNFPEQNKTITVDTITLDELFESKKLPAPIALWMDCEGAELGALKGGPACVSASEWIIAEILTLRGEKSIKRRKGWPGRADVLNCILAAGFERQWEDDGNIMFRRRRQ
jgi:FkbM family methyltransferase